MSREPHPTPDGTPFPLLPARLGAYELLAVLGRGGMGVVYRARHPRLQREVALKLLLAGERATPLQRERFLREAQAAARLPTPARGRGARRGRGAGAVDPRDPGPWANRAIARQSNGDTSGAIADLERFLSLAPEHEKAQLVREALEKLRRGR